MQQIGASLRSQHVSRIYLVHGTFAGLDAGGLYGELARLIPGARRTLGGLQKQLVDAIAGDHGNFTDAYAKHLASALNGHSSNGNIAATTHAPIEVRLFNWSSENHHLGRAEAAVELLAELLQSPPSATQRYLLIGHSHAGNVFALLTNLLSGDRERIDEFFEAASIHYRLPTFNVNDLPLWVDIATRLHDPQRTIDPALLDFVTFGTPIRYGWFKDGYGRLLHLISHRPRRDMPPFLAKFPPTIDEVLHGVGGDFIQQLGIAGTNTPPSLLAPRSWWADRRLHRVVQHNVPGDVFSRLAIGARVPDCGETLLVDYGELDANILRHLAGHGLYTQESLMLFHWQQIATRLYPRRESNHKILLPPGEGAL